MQFVHIAHSALFVKIYFKKNISAWKCVAFCLAISAFSNTGSIVYLLSGVMLLRDLEQKFVNSNVNAFIRGLLNKFEVAVEYDNQHLLIPSLLPKQNDGGVSIPMVRNQPGTSVAEDEVRKTSSEGCLVSHTPPCANSFLYFLHSLLKYDVSDMLRECHCSVEFRTTANMQRKLTLYSTVNLVTAPRWNCPYVWTLSWNIERILMSTSFPLY